MTEICSENKDPDHLLSMRVWSDLVAENTAKKVIIKLCLVPGKWYTIQQIDAAKKIK